MLKQLSVLKKGEKGEKENYRPATIFSKAFERLVYNKLNEFMEKIFSKFLTGFQKNYSAQYAQLRMIENWKTQLNKRNKIGVIIIYLSYAFDIINSQPYGLDSNAASLMRSYVTNRYQPCKIRHSLSEFERITARVLQGSILRIYPWTPAF